MRIEVEHYDDVIMAVALGSYQNRYVIMNYEGTACMMPVGDLTIKDIDLFGKDHKHYVFIHIIN